MIRATAVCARVREVLNEYSCPPDMSLMNCLTSTPAPVAGSNATPLKTSLPGAYPGEGTARGSGPPTGPKACTPPHPSSTYPLSGVDSATPRAMSQCGQY